jgi:release factor glutamine methyltransferase
LSDMTSLKIIRQLYIENLGTLYENSEIDNIFYQIVNHLLNYSKIQLHQNLHSGIEPQKEKEFNNYLWRLKKGEPLQYVLGITEFYNTSIRVDSRVLIPRPETELMVDMIVKSNNRLSGLHIIDLCTGSGCIAIALAKALKNATSTALDISEEALDLARQNAVENSAEILFMKDDLLNLRQKYASYDLIVSNPPYVREMEKKLMHINVLRFEPELALFVTDTDPLVFYQAMATFGVEHLRENGKLYAEINEKLGKEIKALFLSSGYASADILKDIRLKDRFLIARL